MGVRFANNGFFVTPTVMLTTTDSYLQERGRSLSGAGSGVGTALGNDFNSGTLTKDLNPLFWKSGVQGVKTTGVDMPTGDLTVILKFEFGAASDTVRVWYFGENQTMDLATFDANAISATDTIDESMLDTLTFAYDRKENAISEIRIGTTFASVVTLPSPGPVDVAASTVAASPVAVPADGTTASTVTVTLRDGLGVPVEGKDVTLANTSGPGSPVISPAGAVTTNASGQATFTVTSATPGIEDFTATNVTDAQVITQTSSVVFVGSADADLSSVAVSPVFVPADGSSTSTITVTVRGLGGVPLEGKEVTLANTAGPQAAVISPLGAVTTAANGEAAFTVSSNTSGSEQFTATVVTDSVVITQTVTVNFVGNADSVTSTVTSSPGAVVANGTTSSTITVSLKDANGFPVVGHDVTLANTAGPQAATITPLTAVATDSNGVATFTVSSSTLGTEMFTATDTTNSVVVTQTASVEFVDSATPLAFHVSFVQFTPSLGDFEDPAALDGPGGGSGEIWNQIRAVSGNNLLDSNGVATSVGVVTTFSECRQRSTAGLPLLYDALTDFNKGLSRTVTISGLPPGSLYNVWLASTATSAGATERANGTFSTTNATSTPGAQPIDQSVTANTATWEEGNNYVLFESVVVDGSGQISFTAASTEGYRLPLSGFQLVPAGRALIATFEAAGEPGVIDQGNKTIAVNVPFDTDLSTLAPTFTLTTGVCVPVSGSTPSPTFAVQNPAIYTVTDGSTDPSTVNAYTVTIIVGPAPPATTTLVMDLGAGTFIPGGQFGTFGALNLPIPTLPAGSILRAIATDLVLQSTNVSNGGNLAVEYGSNLVGWTNAVDDGDNVIIDVSPGTPKDAVVVKLKRSTLGAGGNIFARLKVTITE